MAVHILGIRHHGPGSARNIKAFLEEHQPDIVLVEGPPDADALLQWADNKELKPPVSILVYQPEDTRRALFYPFAEFSPEWQAIQYAVNNKVPVRFMDLPVTHYFALGNKKEEGAQQNEGGSGEEGGAAERMENARLDGKSIEQQQEQEREKAAESVDSLQPKYPDPISWLAEAAGYDDGEKWWEHQFEYRLRNEEVFDAVREAMQALRENVPMRDDYREKLREAYMRKVIRQAEKEQFKNIAVICGAWHAPALTDLGNQKKDNDLLKGLPKVKTECTWTPWTYNRLSFYSGYGAGIESPGWYHHLWKHPKDNGIRWIVNVARLLRKKRMDISVAHIIEAVRLAETLAVLRNLHRPGLEEMNEAVLTVLCNGESILMQLIHDELTVSNRIGTVPSEIPKPPLQLDIERHQKKLRMPPSAGAKEYVLDLRKESDLERSIFLHRLQLLQISWGTKKDVSGKGTFKEQWSLQWDPDLAVDIIEKGSWGNTVEDAATSFVTDKAGKTEALSAISDLLQDAIPAELPKVVDVLITRINNLAAATGDVIQLMEAIPGLVAVSRYGNVRKTDAEMVSGIARSMITRICISLPPACTSVNEDAAAHLLDLFFKLNDAVNLLTNKETMEEWQQTLSVIAASPNTSPVIGGYATRLLYDYKIMEGEQLVKAFSFSMSLTTAPAIAAAWLEGFLKGSGTVLLIDPQLWQVVDRWVASLDNDNFTQVLPLLRRTFSGFSSPERRKLGEKVRLGDTAVATVLKPVEEELDHERAMQGVPVVMQLLGFRS